MAETSSIEWTDATWNPVTGCSVVSPGCTNCYAMRLAGTRLQHHPSRAGLTTMSKAGPVWNGQVRLNEGWLDQPLRWTRPRRIFVCAHGDLFHEDVPDAWIDQVFAVMAAATQHTFQVLTKRPARMRQYISSLRDRPRYLRLDKDSQVWAPYEGGVPTNIWLGASAEDQVRLNARIEDLVETPAYRRFLSIEPLIAPMSLRWMPTPPAGPGGSVNEYDGLRRLDWVIAGGESGPGARPMHPDWTRQIRDHCAGAGVPFFFKQWGAWTPGENARTPGGPWTGAYYLDDRWALAEFSSSGLEGLHIDDEPDVWRVGKKAAGRLLDGVEHNGMPT
jgi:protein gp37